MGDLLVHNELVINSNTGEYKVEVVENVFSKLADFPKDKTQFLVDKQVHVLYKKQFDQYIPDHKMIFIDALESNKNVDRTSFYVSWLVENQVKIDHTLVAIGGGITQDITCFLASTLFRGMKWEFVPTTLLAQADSCIGSKSSINVGDFKNLMGTFYPPQRILLDISFLNTLEKKDVLSGVGEILKVHMIILNMLL
jgi:3-dehydroquinate synthase